METMPLMRTIPFLVFWGEMFGGAGCNSLSGGEIYMIATSDMLIFFFPSCLNVANSNSLGSYIIDRSSFCASGQ